MAEKHVFISYSRTDTEFAARLEHDLNARGIATWRDVNSIVGGEEWFRAIVRGIHHAYAMVQVITPASQESRWVLREGLYADQRQIPIIPLLPQQYPVPFHLIAMQPIVCETDYTAAIDQLESALRTLAQDADSLPLATRLTATASNSEAAYLDFLLSEMKGELRTARYVSLGATRQPRAQTTPSPTVATFDDFDLDFEHLEPLVQAESIYGERLDQPGDTVEDARIALRMLDRAILLGDPGSGKTTTLQQLAIDLAHAAQRAPGSPLPVFVSLRSYLGQQAFAEFVRAHLGILQSQADRLFADGRVVLLCDALNEMQRTANGRDLVADVRDYLRDTPSWVVSCRVRDYQEDLRDLPDVGKVRLKPLDLPRIKAIIDHRFAAQPDRARGLWENLRGSPALLEAWDAYAAAGHPDLFWEHRAPGFHAPVNLRLSEATWQTRRAALHAWNTMHSDNKRMLPLCRNPFMLFMVCGTFERIGQLPPNRGALFRFFVDNLLKREQRASEQTGRAWIEVDIIRHALAVLAYAMQRSASGTEISRSEAERILHGLPSVIDAGLLLRLAASASLLDVGERIRYTHHLLQEYFASAVMGIALDTQRPATEFWPADRWWEPRGWDETAIILAGVRGAPEVVARWIAPAQPEVAYEALTQSGIDVNAEQIAPETRAALVTSARAKTGQANPLGRAAAYRLLGRLDADDRAGIGLAEGGLPALDWVEIPAGEFTYQKGGKLDLPTFFISRYPITYRQFQAFIDAEDGFHNGAWWADLAADDHHRAAPGEQAFKYWNHPRENVSWYDAVAFCRWLSAHLGYAVRLPTEHEWEKAARGTDGRAYPWGPSYLNGYANVNETYRNRGPFSLGMTNAVGMYPQGASPYGVLDLSGNVWEWCLNAYDPPHPTDVAGTAARTVRGGSWGLLRDNARCTFRERDVPDNRFFDLGFRVVAQR